MNTVQRAASRAKRRYQADPMAMFRVIGRAQPFTQQEQDQLNLPVMLAIDAIATGKDMEDDFQTLAAAINVSMICAERIDPLVEQVCIVARDALMRMHARQVKHGTWGFDGPGYIAVKDAADVYCQLTSLLNAGELQAALQECLRRMQAGEVMEPLQ